TARPRAPRCPAGSAGGPPPPPDPSGNRARTTAASRTRTARGSPAAAGGTGGRTASAQRTNLTPVPEGETGGTEPNVTAAAAHSNASRALDVVSQSVTRLCSAIEPGVVTAAGSPVRTLARDVVLLRAGAAIGLYRLAEFGPWVA